MHVFFLFLVTGVFYISNLAWCTDWFPRDSSRLRSESQRRAAMALNHHLRQSHQPRTSRADNQKLVLGPRKLAILTLKNLIIQDLNHSPVEEKIVPLTISNPVDMVTNSTTAYVYSTSGPVENWGIRPIDLETGAISEKNLNKLENYSYEKPSFVSNVLQMLMHPKESLLFVVYQINENYQFSYITMIYNTLSNEPVGYWTIDLQPGPLTFDEEGKTVFQAGGFGTVINGLLNETILGYELISAGKQIGIKYPSFATQSGIEYAGLIGDLQASGNYVIWNSLVSGLSITTKEVGQDQMLSVPGSQDAVSRFRFSTDNKYLAFLTPAYNSVFASANVPVVRIYNLNTKTTCFDSVTASENNEDHIYESLAFSEDQTKIYVSHSTHLKSEILVFDAQNCAHLNTLSIPSNSVYQFDEIFIVPSVPGYAPEMLVASSFQTGTSPTRLDVFNLNQGELVETKNYQGFPVDVDRVGYNATGKSN